MPRLTGPLLLDRDALVERLRTTQRELRALAPAPRVEVDRDALLAMVDACLLALTSVKA